MALMISKLFSSIHATLKHIGDVAPHENSPPSGVSFMEKLLLWYILDFSILLGRTPAFHVVRLGFPLAFGERGLEDGTSVTTANWGVAGLAEEVS